jgi:hypothetical protein
LDNNKQLVSCSVNEVSQALTILSSIRVNNSTPEQVITASAMIIKEYPKLTLGELQQIIVDGIMQKFNRSEQPQYNDVPSLMFWLRKYKLDNTTVFY